jgi:hypothetical protein
VRISAGVTSNISPALAKNVNGTKVKGEVVVIDDMRAYRGSTVERHSLLTMAIDAGELSPSRSGRCTSDS